MNTTIYTQADEKPFIVDIIHVDTNETLETFTVIAPDYTFAALEASKITKFPYHIISSRLAA